LAKRIDACRRHGTLDCNINNLFCVAEKIFNYLTGTFSWEKVLDQSCWVLPAGG
jgi:hypothetical protein